MEEKKDTVHDANKGSDHTEKSDADFRHASSKATDHARKSQSDFRHIVRVANTDIDGNKHLVMALQKINGVGNNFANLICSLSNIKTEKKTGTLSETEIKKIDMILSDPENSGAPVWMLNRRKDYETGDDKHILGGDLKFQNENDKKRLQKIKSYRGLRRSVGLPVRGQRTKSNFRRNKGKGLGVKRKSAKSGRV